VRASQTTSLHRKTLHAGATLFLAGDVGEAAYLVEAGRLVIYVQSDEGELVLAHRGPGELVGEMALLDGGIRSACVRAVEPCTLVIITREQLSRRLAETDPILRMCLSVVLERYRETVGLLAAKGSEPPPRPTGLEQPLPRPHLTDAIDTLLLEREINAGLERGEFASFLQPIVRLESQRLAGFEALMRWHHPTRGLLQPAAFIPVAEASGAITALTAYAVAELVGMVPAIAGASRANPCGCEGVPFVAINVSGHDVASPDFPAMVSRLVAAGGLDPRCLKFEITESSLITNSDLTAGILAELRAAGFGVAIDDFGTGYSSLSYLSTLPATTLKIDRSFVRTMLTESTSFRIIRTIVRLAEELEISVVAEGIEDEKQAEALRRLGCEFGQGYYFGKPVSYDDALRDIAAWPARNG
jgi:EAL domain-containing protein (putative c-di-GMP-specific phosphodiesterase class I)